MRNVQRWRRRRRPVAMTAALIVVVVVGLDRRGVTAGAVCRGDTCNDGGCSYAAAANGSAVRCDCNRVSAGLRVGADCGSYADACSDNTFRPCLNGGTCVSALGFAYCDCPAGYGGTHEQCEHRQTGKSNILSKFLFRNAPRVQCRLKDFQRPGAKLFFSMKEYSS